MIASDLDIVSLLDATGICLQIFFIDLLLSADNALLIAMASRQLPPAQMRQVAIMGMAGAIALRVAMAGAVLVLLEIPYLRIVAALTLLVLAVRLSMGTGEPTAPRRRTVHADMASAVIAIITADAVMSLDNVVAIAAVARGSLLLMGLGLAMSIPMLIQGSALIHRFLVDNGLLVVLGGMFLGWIAGQIAVADPAIAPWIQASAPALVFAVPAACAIFVLWEGQILKASGAEVIEGGLDAG